MHGEREIDAAPLIRPGLETRLGDTMSIQRSRSFMRTKRIVFAALLSLGFVLPAGASPRTLPVPPVQEMETPPVSEPRQKPVTPPLPPRGQLLYENHCMSCHESVVHIRTRQHTKSLPELQAQVLQWADYLQLRWGKEEVEDVASHLNSQYYKFEPR